jgi:heme-degrading monooxygenase HmoA
MSQWASKEDFDAFLRSDAFRAVTSWGKAEILRGRPKHKVYQSP